MALDGQLAAQQRLLLGLHIGRLGEIDRDLAEVEAAIGGAMQPFAAQQALLVTIPGVDALKAAAIAEIGPDMSVFGTAQRLAAWAELAKVLRATPVACQQRAGFAPPTTRARASRSGAAPARATPPQGHAGRDSHLRFTDQGQRPA